MSKTEAPGMFQISLLQLSQTQLLPAVTANVCAVILGTCSMLLTTCLLTDNIYLHIVEIQFSIHCVFRATILH